MAIEPADNDRLAELCGQFDQHLRAKIHNSPDAGDADAVRECAQGVTDRNNFV